MPDYGLKLEENEETFELIPVGIRYRCPFCHEGEMIIVVNKMGLVEGNFLDPLKDHTCNKCGKTLKLPKTYPYIEWIPKESRGDNNDTNEVCTDGSQHAT